MRAKKPSQGKEIKTTALRLISGSDDEDFTRILVTQVDTSLWVEHSDSEQRDRQFNAAITAMKGMKPRDELEGMLSAQLIAIHNAAMECCRRAMLGNQTFEGRRENLNQANKLSRTYAALTEALDRSPRQGPAADHRRARQRACWWTGDRRCRHPEGWKQSKIGGTNPCHTRNYQ